MENNSWEKDALRRLVRACLSGQVQVATEQRVDVSRYDLKNDDTLIQLSNALINGAKLPAPAPAAEQQETSGWFADDKTEPVTSGFFEDDDLE